MGEKPRQIVHTSHRREEEMLDATTRDLTKRQVLYSTRDKTKRRVPYTTKHNSIYRSADGDVNKTNKHADNDGAANTTYKLEVDGEWNAGSGVKSLKNSGAIEVRFMIDVNRRRRDFNLSMRLRDFIVESRVIDPTFSILPLGGNGGETITKPEEWPNIKEGIDKYYSHWSRQKNVAVKIKIVTALSMMQLKNQSGTFLTYLKRKGVHINYTQLGMVETVTLDGLDRHTHLLGAEMRRKNKPAR
jgi:hypothetical protein